MLLPHKFNDFTQEYLQRFVSVENGAVEVQYTPAFTRCELDFESETVIRAEVYATRPYTETETAAITGNSCKLLNSDYYEMLQVPVQLVGETSGSYYEFASCLYDYPTDIAITRIQGTLTLSSTKNQTACLFAAFPEFNLGCRLPHQNKRAKFPKDVATALGETYKRNVKRIQKSPLEYEL